MSSYRLARRSFIAGIGGAFGLEILLRNMEAAAQGATSPARMLLTHFPIGTYKQSYLPKGGQTDFTLSPILQPFEALRNDMIVLYGLSDLHLKCPGGGGHEAGTPFTTTGAQSPGTRANGGEGDDGVAGGPSFDQIFLKHVPGLKQGLGYINTLADARVDSLETSTQCLSYGEGIPDSPNYQTRSIKAANPANTNITEYTPNLPELSPANAYAKLFSNFVPGGGTDAAQQAALHALRTRKSVLDHSLRELERLRTLAPASERDKIDAHASAIRQVEQQLSESIAGGGSSGGMTCTTPTPPDDSLKGQTGSKFNYGEGNEVAATSDEDIHEKIGKAHAAVILAAFQCDIIRVATFQWSPGTNHVSFKGRYPADPERSFMHHPMSHRIGSSGFFNGTPQTGTSADASLYQFLVSINTWYNEKTADILQSFKDAKDGFGNSILDYTVVPYLTEVGDPSHSRTNKASLIFGGKALGMKGGQFLNFESKNRPQVDVWLTAAQALLQTDDPLAMLPNSEKFDRNGAGVIKGLWEKPA